MTKPIIPSSADIIGAAISSLIRNRFSTLDHVNWGEGNYATIMAGLEAQARLAIQRLADGVVGSGLRGSGDQLRSYVESEAELPPTLGRTYSVGSVTLTRTGTTQGRIPKGTRFRRDAEPLADVPIVAAEYESLADVPVATGQTSVTVPLISKLDGVASSKPYFAYNAYQLLTPVDALFDASFTVSSYDMGGGSDGLTDADIVRYARTYFRAQSGPTRDAVLLATLGASGVKYALIQDPAPLGGTNVYVADAAWGSSTAWLNQVQQSISDSTYTGYAEKITVHPIPNQIASLSVTSRLRDTKYTADTTEIDNAIRSAVKGYFDGRDNFNVYSEQTLRSVLSRAHKRILVTTAATITTAAPPTYVHVFAPNITLTYQGPV